MPDFLVFCTVIARLCGAKIILDIHDPMPNTFASKFKTGDNGFIYRLLLWQERLSAAYSDRVITVHHPVRDGILLKHGLPLNSVGIVANFADDDLFQTLPHYRLDYPIRLVFHGTILERSGLRLLMNALAKVEHKNRLQVRIIGEGDFSQALHDLISMLGLGQIVDFVNRTYPVHEIPAMIADCHVGIVPLRISSVTNYALPLKLLEYVSMGLPVISVRSAAISYYFKEEDCLFYQWDDPESLRRVIDGILEEVGILEQYRERALAIRHQFLWSEEKKKYVDLLRQLNGCDATVCATQ